MTWVVVLYSDGGVLAVPTCWMVRNKEADMCFYPNAEVRKVARDRMAPEHIREGGTWYQYRVLSKTSKN